MTESEFIDDIMTLTEKKDEAPRSIWDGLDLESESLAKKCKESRYHIEKLMKSDGTIYFRYSKRR